jgi:hypothetical protein
MHTTVTDEHPSGQKDFEAESTQKASNAPVRDIQLNNFEKKFQENNTGYGYLAKKVNFLSFLSGETGLQVLLETFKGKSFLNWQEINGLFELAEKAHTTMESKKREMGLLTPSWLGSLTCDRCGSIIAVRNEELAAMTNILGNFHTCGGQFQVRNYFMPPFALQRTF